MGRPPLALGEAGTIRTYGWHDGKWRAADKLPDGAKPDKWKAIANYRDFTGETSPVEKHGRTEAKAKAALNAEIRERASRRLGVSANSRFREFADVWLADLPERVSTGTEARYREALRRDILPYLGELRINEIRVSLLDGYFRDLRDRHGANSRRLVRTVVKQVLDIPVRQDLIPHNPVRSISRIGGGAKRAPRALLTDELVEFLALLDADRGAQRSDLPDLVRVMLGTGMRIGEACGLRWCDIVMGSTPEDSLIQVTGNAVYVSGLGVQRHSGKTFAARRNIPMPAFLHMLFAVRRPEEARDTDPVFPNTSGGLKKPGVFQDALRRTRKRIAPADDPDRWDWLVSHTLRKTTATQLDEGGATAREIADILGHADVSMTLSKYLGRGRPNARAGQMLDAAHRKPV